MRMIAFLPSMFLLSSGALASDGGDSALSVTVQAAAAEESAALNRMACAIEDAACLKAEIIERGRLDRWIRHQLNDKMICGADATEAPAACFTAVLATMTDLDAANTARLKQFLAEHGWPRSENWGAETERAAWYMVQHGTTAPDPQKPNRWDVELAKSVLPDVEKSVADGNLTTWHYAALYDRIALNDGRKQRYGTQFMCVDGAYRLSETEDPEKLNARRAEIGFEPIEKQGFAGRPCGG